MKIVASDKLKSSLDKLSKINVLYLSYDGMTDPLGQSQIIPYLRGLSQRGYHFTLVSFEKPDRHTKSKKDIQKLVNQYDIDWIPLTYHKSPPVFSTLYDLWILRRTVKKLHRKYGFKIIHCRSYLTALIGLYMKQCYATKFIFDMRGFWADERVEGNIWNLKNPFFKIIYKYFKAKELQFLSNADYTISLTEEAKKEIHSWKNLKGNPVSIKVIPCCADLEHFNPKRVHKEQLQLLREKLKVSEADFLLLYLGSIGTWYLLDEMLDFFLALLQHKPSSKFLFLTNEPSEKILEVAAKKNIDQNKLIITQSSRKYLPTYLSLANIAIFFIKPSYSKKASSPTKQGEIMAMGIPIICNWGVGDSSEIVKESSSGILIEKFQEDVYNDAILQIDKLLQVNSERIRSCAEQLFSLEKGVQSYAEVYHRFSQFQ